jgi:subtilisin family serine protease
VVQSVSTGGSSLDCLDMDTFIPKAYGAGARIQNMSFGGGSYGQYDSFAQLIDDFVWQHKDHLMVISAGNEGMDCEPTDSQGGCLGNGVIDEGSITPPATAKNAISVGASENNHPPSASSCRFSPQDSLCWNAFSFGNAGLNNPPFATDFISNNPAGLAGFSSRGPTLDGRLKPEIVAPGTNVISARSHHLSASYPAVYSADYAYDSGTSMAAPMVSGLAALVRQWLAQHGVSAPSAALVKALLLNGAANIAPGQYGTGAQREIPAAWPNNAEGWGRASVVGAVGLGDPSHRFWENTVGLVTGASADYSVALGAGQTLRATLVWTDPAAIPLASKTLVNDLDLQVIDPSGAAVALGNAAAPLRAACRGAGLRAGADICNNQEAVEFTAAAAGSYKLRVRGAVVPEGPQPFALVVGAPTSPVIPSQNAPTAAPAPVQVSVTNGSPLATLTWGAVLGARSYEVRLSDSAGAGQRVFTVGATSLGMVLDSGSYQADVRGCNDVGCGPYSLAVPFSVSATPLKIHLPQIRR